MQRAYHESGVWQHLKGGRIAQGLIKGGAGHRDPMTHLPHLYEDNMLFVDDAISRLRGKESDKSPECVELGELRCVASIMGACYKT